MENTRHKPKDVAVWLNVSLSHVYDLIKGGELVAIRVGKRSMRVTDESYRSFTGDQAQEKTA